MKLKPGVVICPTLEESEELFRFLHENGAIWASRTPLIDDTGEFRLLSDGINRGYEIAKNYEKIVVYTFSLNFTSSDDPDFDDDEEAEQAKAADLFWVSVDEYIAAHNQNLKIDFECLANLL